MLKYKRVRLPQRPPLFPPTAARNIQGALSLQIARNLGVIEDSQHLRLNLEHFPQPYRYATRYPYPTLCRKTEYEMCLAM
jgi:hypothetical protein